MVCQNLLGIKRLLKRWLPSRNNKRKRHRAGSRLDGLLLPLYLFKRNREGVAALPASGTASDPYAPGHAWAHFMSSNTNPVSEAAIRVLMRERRVDRETAIQIYLKEQMEALSQ